MRGAGSSTATAPGRRTAASFTAAARGSAVLLLALTAGCGRAYHAQPLQPEASAQAFGERSLADARVQARLHELGLDTDPWPLPRWNLAQLTAVATLWHPDIDLARARAAVAAAEVATSRIAPPFTATVRPEYNRRVASGDTPWGLGMVLAVPIDIGGKRVARTAQLEHLQAAAETDIGVAAWRVRSRLRRYFVDLDVAQRMAAALAAEQAQRRGLLALIDKRVQAGYAASGDAAAVRARLAETEVALGRAAIRRDQALAGIAEATSVPLAVLVDVEFDFAALDAEAVNDADALRSLALRNRLDLRRKLDEYAAAEAAVRLEVARRYPDIALGPGYFWDADHGVWSLAVFAVGATAARNDALVREAEARREVEARAFLALQANVIAEAAGASARWQRAHAVQLAAGEQTEQARRYASQVEHRFDRGDADRVELAQARTDALVVERAALGAVFEAQLARAALEDAVQRPLDDAVLAGIAPTIAAPDDRAINPMLLDND